MLTGAQQLNVTQPQDSVTLSYLASMFTIKYLPFGMSGTEAESVTDATLLFTKTSEETLQTYNKKSALYGVTVKCRDYFQHS